MHYPSSRYQDIYKTTIVEISTILEKYCFYPSKKKSKKNRLFEEIIGKA